MDDSDNDGPQCACKITKKKANDKVFPLIFFLSKEKTYFPTLLLLMYKKNEVILHPELKDNEKANDSHTPDMPVCHGMVPCAGHC